MPQEAPTTGRGAVLHSLPRERRRPHRCCCHIDVRLARRPAGKVDHSPPMAGAGQHSHGDCPKPNKLLATARGCRRTARMECRAARQRLVPAGHFLMVRRLERLRSLMRRAARWCWGPNLPRSTKARLRRLAWEPHSRGGRLAQPRLPADPAYKGRHLHRRCFCVPPSSPC